MEGGGGGKKKMRSLSGLYLSKKEAGGEGEVIFAGKKKEERMAYEFIL